MSSTRSVPGATDTHRRRQPTLVVALPSCPTCMFPPPITALDRVIDIGGRSFTLGASLTIAVVMTTRIYRRLVEIEG